MDPSSNLQSRPEKSAARSPARVSGAWTKGVVHAFRKLGLEVEQLCATIDVDIEVFLDPTGRPPRDASGKLWRAALEANGDRFLGLSAAEAWEARVDHLVYLLLLSANTFGEGLAAGVRFQELLSNGRVITLGEDPRHHALHIHRIEHELPILSHEIEFIAAILVKQFRFATDDAFELKEVRFEHPYRGNLEQYKRVFRAPVRFGQRDNTLLISDASWRRHLSNANHTLHQQLEQMAANQHAELADNSFLDDVRERIRGLLPRGNFGIDCVAGALHMTPRTLQRRLQEEGTTFRALVDATRRAVVLDCVERQQAPHEIVRHVGYTNPRSFRRAMKRWNL